MLNNTVFNLFNAYVYFEVNFRLKFIFIILLFFIHEKLGSFCISNSIVCIRFSAKIYLLWNLKIFVRRCLQFDDMMLCLFMIDILLTVLCHCLKIQLVKMVITLEIRRNFIAFFKLDIFLWTFYHDRVIETVFSFNQSVCCFFINVLIVLRRFEIDV